MPKSKPKAAARSTARKSAKATSRKRPTASKPVAGPDTKHARVIAMLRKPAGATIAAIMAVTDWQQHSVRGFLAGVVRKRLKLKLGSKKLDGNRVYHIGAGGKRNPTSPQPKHGSA